jgi:phenylacetaldehyde dehydrogenase
MAIADPPKVGGATERFLAAPKLLLIDGEWRDAASGKTFETYDPATGDVLARVAEADSADVDIAVAAARRALDGPWSKMGPAERGRIIHRIGELILENAEQLAELEALDNGKPKAVALAADVQNAADIFFYMSGWATKLNGATMEPTVPYCPARSSMPTLAASRSVSSDRSSPGTSRC